MISLLRRKLASMLSMQPMSSLSPRAASGRFLLRRKNRSIAARTCCVCCDCSEPVVTAVVGEAVYNRLQVGAPVRFRPRDGREELPGTVIRLSAAPLLPANLAIPSSALTPGSYHITVAVPKLAQGCLIGRTGRVFFDNGPLEGQ